MVKRIWFGIFFLISIVGLIFANLQQSSEPQKKERELKYEITVTANRIKTSTKETASSVTVITREELTRLNKVTVLEALDEVMGLSFAQNGPAGSQATLSIRGANPETTKVMIDGMELNDPITPGRTFDLSLLMIDSIERIEIIRGPQSSLYGSDAMGGVVNIITRQEQGKPQMNFSAQTGSYSTVSSNAEISGSTKRVSYSASATYYQSDGFSAASRLYKGNTENDGYKNLTLAGKIGYNPSAKLDLNFTIRSISSHLNADNYGGEFGDDPNNMQDYNAIRLTGGVRGLWAHNRWESNLTFSYLDYDRRHENPTDELHPFDSDKAIFKSNLTKIDWQNNIFAHTTNTITAGIEYWQEEGESEYYSESLWGSYESFFPKQGAHNFGVYFQDQIKMAKRFFATIGGRFDRHSQAGGAFTYRIAPTYVIPQSGTQLKASLGSGYKAPTLYQLYAPPTYYGPVGNENLNPETCMGWDIGIEHEFLDSRLTIGALYYANTFENLIDFDFIHGYFNVGHASTKGAELFCWASPTTDWQLAAEYTRMDAKDETTGAKLLRRPQGKFMFKVSHNLLNKGHITLNLIYVGKREDLFFHDFTSTRVILDPYTLVNTAADYNIRPNIQVFLRLDNMLNQEYETIKGYGTPGFSMYVGLKLYR